MYENNSDYYNSPVEISEERVALYVAKVMGWMTIGLFTTLTVMVLIGTNPSLQRALFSIPRFPMLILMAELIVVMVLSVSLNKISSLTATIMFFVYAGLTGVTLSVVALIYYLPSVVSIFLLTTAIFLVMAIYGFTTRKDLSGIGSLAIFALFGIILAGVFNWFFNSSTLDFVITIIGILVFIGLIAYDIQRIKGYYISAVSAGIEEESEIMKKVSIMGALTLYLDFINLFLKLLRLLGKKKSN